MRGIEVVGVVSECRWEEVVYIEVESCSRGSLTETDAPSCDY